MITDFERRLATVLGARLPAPFTGRVGVAPGPVAGAGPQLIVGVARAERAEADLGGVRREVVPGSADPRRVVRLGCTVGVEVRPAAAGDRAEQVAGVDAALFELDAPDLRDGSALAGPGDPGFRIRELRVVGCTAPLAPAAADAPPVGLTVAADGWFWPIGVAGEAGRAIAEVRVRGALLPLALVPPAPRLVAGGGPVDLAIRIGSAGPVRLIGPGPSPPALPFGALALAVRAPGGQPGAGTLAGGAAGTAGVRLVPLSDGTAAFQYTPPAAPAIDELVIALDDGGGNAGVELARLPLRTRAA